MPWEETQMHMHELVQDEEMATWPLPPALLTQVVRLVAKTGCSPMLEKVKELKVRARVLLGLGRMYLERGHHDCLGTTAALMHAERARKLQQYSERMERSYPSSIYGGEEGAIPPEILAVFKETQARKRRKVDSPFLGKDATPADVGVPVEEVFQGVPTVLWRSAILRN